MYKVLGCLLFFSLFSLPSGSLAAPNAHDVRSTLSKILKSRDLGSLGESKRRTKRVPRQKRKKSLSIGEFFQRYKTLFIFLLIGFFLFILFQLIMRMNPYYKKEYQMKRERPDSNKNKNHKELMSNDYWNYAQKAAKNNQFKEAVIYLHRACIYSLVKKSMIPSTESLTNNQIKNLIRNENQLYINFSSISLIAEIANFSEQNIFKKDFEIAQESFIKGFQ